MFKASLSLLALLPLSPLLVAQAAGDAPRFDAKLEARAPDKGARLRWSPKGAKVPLADKDGALVGRFTLGPKGVAPIQVRMERRAGAERFERLAVDMDRNGSFSANEWLECTAIERRGKWWSSFSTTLPIPIPITRKLDSSAPQQLQAPTPRPYPISLWFVEDPSEPDAPRSLRWSRRGWHQGTVEVAGKPAFVLVCEMRMDGVFDRNDSWALARTEKALLSARSRSTKLHAWLDGRAYRLVELDPHGRALSFEPFDPGVTQEEEEKRNDRTLADRRAPLAKKPLAFGHDYAAAMARAKQEGKRVFLDFETDWCGPCKAMNRIVYTKQPVVDAAKDVICVKLDGDKEKALVKKYGVKGYPTLILLDSSGKQLRRAAGYQGVKQMRAFFR